MVIDRLKAYAEAGADCLYAPGIRTKEQIAAVVKAVHPKPVNLLQGWPGVSVAEATELGVRRISVGGSLARAAWGGFMRAAREIAEKGTFDEFGNAHPGAGTQQDVQLRRSDKLNAVGARPTAFRSCVWLWARYLLWPLSSGGLPVRFTSGPVGAADGGVCGCAGAAPVVRPGAVLLARGVTSRMPGGAAGGEDCVFCAVDVPFGLVVEWFEPVEHGAEYHRDGDREYRDFAAAGGTLGEFRIDLQFIVEASGVAELFFGSPGAIGIVRGAIGIVGGVGTIGIVRIAFVGHDRVPPLDEGITRWRGGGFLNGGDVWNGGRREPVRGTGETERSPRSRPLRPAPASPGLPHCPRNCGCSW